VTLAKLGGPGRGGRDVFMEMTEKGHLPRFRLFRRGGIGVWRMQKKSSGEKTALRRIKTWGVVIYAEPNPGAKMEIPVYMQYDRGRIHFSLLKLHRIGGVAAGLLLLILGVSGSVMAFSGEIDRLLHPSLFKVVPEGQPLSLSQLASSAASVLHAGESIDTCLPSTRADASYSFTVFGAHHRVFRQIFVDQYTDRVLGSLTAVRFTSIMQALHSIAGVLGCSSIILVFLVFSGLCLLWPRKRIKIGLSGNVQRLSFDLHNTIGFFASLFLFLFAITGIYMVFGPPSYAITSKAVTQPAFSAPQVGLKAVSLDLVATAAKNTLPGATVLWIVIPRQPREAYLVKMRFSEDRSDNGSSIVWIDQFSGKVLAVANSRAVPLGNKFQTISRVIHTGAVFGNEGRALAAIMSLILVLQTVTGLHMWWNRRRRKVPRASASQLQPVLPSLQKTSQHI
jgi:uncharacterized iron-regulated membrane protein